MEILDSGKGQLLGWHDPEEHREWVNKNKSSLMKDKVMNLRRAVSEFVTDGAYIAIGGFGHVRIPMAAIYEIIREKKRGLVLSGKVGCHDVDSLIAADCVSKIEVGYCFGHELRGLSPASRRAVETGKLEVAAEWSNAAFQWRYKAAASGLPWIPGYVMLGTDTFKFSAAKAVKDPLSPSGRPICLIPACYPDVAIIHVHRCDIYGNCQIDNSLAMDFELARAARRLIITTEKVIPNSKIRDEPQRTCIPYFYVDAVVEVPYGCHPGNMPSCYYFDEAHIAEYLRMTRTVEGTADYFKKYVYDIGFDEYLQKIGGKAKLDYLKNLEEGKAEFVYPWLKS